MQVFWEVILEPLIELFDPAVIVEIGSDQGANTKLLVAAGAAKGRVVHSIDPAPNFDVDAVQIEYGERFVPHRGLSLDVLPTIETPLDLVLIDGDHNWYTVINELRLLEEHALQHGVGYPLVLLHDVCWPYARRDLYYNPDTIPTSERQPYAMGGMLPGQSELVEGGGLNPHLHHATVEHGEQNGVLTAVEDFLSTTGVELHLIKLPVWHGLGILYGSHHVNDHPDLARFLEDLTIPDPICQLMEQAERQTVDLLIEVRRRERKLRGAEARLGALQQRERSNQRHYQELREHNQQLREALGSLKQQVAASQSRLADAQRRIQAQSRTLEELTRSPAERARRKLEKLRRDPIRFFEDAKLIRVLRRGSSARATHRSPSMAEKERDHGKRSLRKLRKLRNDPVQFVRDVKLLRTLERRTYESYRKHRRARTRAPERHGSSIPASPPSGNHPARKWRKLMRDPVQFFLDSKLARPLVRRPARLRDEAELIRGSDLFDAEFYTSQQPRGLEYDGDAIEHYLLFGAAAGHKPHPDFDSSFYLLSNPDVRRAGVNPLVHYLRCGKEEGRSPTPSGHRTPSSLRDEIELIRSSELFDIDYYLENNPHVARAGLDPVRHFAEDGWCADQNPGPGFDVEFYLHSNPDVRRAGMNPLYHYLRVGRDQGREPRPMDEATAAAHIERARAWATTSTQRFSVVMPTWNRRETVCRAIDSVLAQSFPPHELIVSDDGSTDGTVAHIRERYASELASGRIALLENPHRGVSAARNAGLAASTGEWIAYLDSDNAWRENYLLLMGHALHCNPDRRAAYAQLSVRDGVNQREFVRRRHFDLQALRETNYIDLNIYVHHRSLYEEKGGFDEELRRLVDWDLILRQLADEDPAYVPFVLCDYFLAGSLNNITNSVPLEANLSAVRRKLERAQHESAAQAGRRSGRLAYLAGAGSEDVAAAEIAALREMGYAVTPISAADPNAVPTALAKLEAQWCHAHLVPARELLKLETCTIRGYSLRLRAADIFEGPGPNDLVREIAESRRCCAIFVENFLQEEVLVSRGVPRHKLLRSRVPFIWSDAFRHDAALPEPGSPLRVLAIAPLVPDSGLVNLMEAAAQLRASVSVCIAGIGPQEERLRRMIDELEATNVELIANPSSREERKELLQAADLFAFPYAPSWHSEYDGAPSVILEAVDAGVPVLMTRTPATRGLLRDQTSAFVAPVADSEGLATQLENIAVLPSAALKRVADNALGELRPQVSAAASAQAISSVVNPSLDIVLVATDAISWSNFRGLVQDLMVLTSTPFCLKLVDNGCDDAHSALIQRMASGRPNVEVFRLDAMVGLGVASNHVFERCRGDYIIYICANEGTVIGRGWERPLLDYMVANPDVSLGGTLVSSPEWLTGREYAQQKWFHAFRGQELARSQPDRELAHVQGGLYILRRQAFEEHGGFAVDHNYMDVEYSLYLESRGTRLGSIPAILSLSSKTRPTFRAHLDERVTALHPVLTDDDRQLVDSFAEWEDALYCNVRGAFEPFDSESRLFDGRVSAISRSHGFTRAAYRYLALSGFAFRGLSLTAHLPDDSLDAELASMFASVHRLEGHNGDLLSSALQNSAADLLLVHNAPREWLEDLHSVFHAIRPGGGLVCSFGSDEPFDAAAGAIAEEQGYRCESVGFHSRSADFGLHGLFLFRRADGVGIAKMVCNICGSREFARGPGGRLAANGSLPRCTRCQSLERHRAIRSLWASLPPEFLSGKSALQFSEDLGADPTRFGSLEVSVYGGANSLDLQRIDRSSEAYDIAICNHVLEHVLDDVTAITELLRVVRRDGWLLLSVPDPIGCKQMRDWGWPDASQHGHYRIYSLQGFLGRIRKAAPDVHVLLLPTQDPVTGQMDVAFACSYAPDALSRLARFCRGLAPEGHPFRLELVAAAHSDSNRKPELIH